MAPGGQFGFLGAEFPVLAAEASLAERMALANPRYACFSARRVVELALRWAFDNDKALRAPYERQVSAMLHEASFKRLAGDQVFDLGRRIIRLGNKAAHEPAPISQGDAVQATSALFEFTYWFARTYARQGKPPPDLAFDPRALPDPSAAAARAKAAAQAKDQAIADAEARAAESLAQVQALMAQLAERDAALAAEREAALADASTRAALEAEHAALQVEVTKAKAEAAAVPDTHDYSEAETRTHLIDAALAEAGWPLDDPRDREFKVTGMPDGKGGFVDYVLWGDDGRPLAVVEAKRTSRSARAGEHQAKLYADRLEAAFGQRPVIFTTNGFEHRIWDDLAAPPRAIAGFLTKDELSLLVQRRSTRRSLADLELDHRIVERPYQHRAIRKIAEAFEADNERKALIVMATGAGKTRTVVALSDLLIRANWAKRVLFLADRRALVRQAVNAFKEFLPDSSPVNLLTERGTEGRVYVATYPTMLGLLDERDAEGRARFGPGHFDLVVIDEAHRSVFRKYRAIFDHFDALLVGLTATPREDIDRNTYALFDLEDGVPTDAYTIEEAVNDGYLVPPRAVDVPLRFVRQGIAYADLDDDAKEQMEEADWGDAEVGGEPPEEISAADLNLWFFNEDTVDKAIEVLMTEGIKVHGGDRIGKTIVFARNQRHADFIVDRFNANYPDQKGTLARVITHQTEFSDRLIEEFEQPDSPPHVAVSVDMLDTGVDVPEVVNLVFFKPVHSKIKFWQMIGRGTRLRPDLFGPDQPKTHFRVFDLCGNFEYFGAHPDGVTGAPSATVLERRFLARVDLLGALHRTDPGQADLWRHTADLLWQGVRSINVDNVVARPHRRTIERFSTPDAWNAIDDQARRELAVIATLPVTATPDEPDGEPARRFDVLALRLQLAVLRAEDPGRLRDQVTRIAELLEGYPTIPAVAAELPLLAEVQTESWWEGPDVAAVEQLRRRVRGLVGFIKRVDRKIVYLDIADELGDLTEIDLGGLIPTGEYEQFRRKATAYLREHRGEAAIAKIHRGEPVTAADLEELRRILVDSGIATAADLERADTEAGGFGIFVRSLVGLDRGAAKAAFADFLDGSTYTAAQIDFVNLLIDALTHDGIVEPARFYESPFTDMSPSGPESLFTDPDLDALLEVLDRLRRHAAA